MANKSFAEGDISFHSALHSFDEESSSSDVLTMENTVISKELMTIRHENQRLITKLERERENRKEVEAEAMEILKCVKAKYDEKFSTMVKNYEDRIKSMESRLNHQSEKVVGEETSSKQINGGDVVGGGICLESGADNALSPSSKRSTSSLMDKIQEISTLGDEYDVLLKSSSQLQLECLKLKEDTEVQERLKTELVDRLTKENQDLKEELKKLRGQLEAIESESNDELTLLRTKMKELTESIKQMEISFKVESTKFKKEKDDLLDQLKRIAEEKEVACKLLVNVREDLKVAQEEVNTVRKKCQQLEGEKEKLMSQIKTLDKEVLDLKDDRKERLSQIKYLETENNEYNKELVSLRNQVKELSGHKVTVDNLVAENKKLLDTLKKDEAEKEASSKRLSKLEKDLTAAEEKLKPLDSLKKANSGLKSDLERLLNQVKALEAANKDLKQQETKQATECTRLAKEVEKYKCDVQKLSKEKKDTLDNLSKARIDNEANLGSKKQLEDHLKAAQEDLKMVSGLKKEIETVKREKDQLQDHVKNLETRNQDLVKEVAALKAELSQVSEKLVALQKSRNDRNNLEEENKTLSDKLKKVEKERESLAEQLASSQCNLDTTQKKLKAMEKLKSDSEDLRKKNQELLRQMQSLEATNKDFSKELKETRAKLKKMEAAEDASSLKPKETNVKVSSSVASQTPRPATESKDKDMSSTPSCLTPRPAAEMKEMSSTQTCSTPVSALHGVPSDKVGLEKWKCYEEIKKENTTLASRLKEAELLNSGYKLVIEEKIRLETEKKKLEADLKETEAQLKLTREELNKLSSKYQESIEKNQAMDTRHKELTQKVESLENEVKIKEGLAQKLKANNETLKKASEDIEKQASEFEALYETQQRDYEKLCKQLDEYKDYCQELEQKLEATQKDLSSTEKKVLDLEQALQLQEEEHQKEVDRIEYEKRNFESALEANIENLKQSDEEIESLRHSLDNYKVYRCDLEKELMTIKEEATRHLTELNAFKAKNHELCDALDFAIRKQEKSEARLESALKEFEAKEDSFTKEKVRMQEQINQLMKLLDVVQSKSEKQNKKHWYGINSPSKGSVTTSSPLKTSNAPFSKDFESALNKERQKNQCLIQEIDRLQSELSQCFQTIKAYETHIESLTSSSGPESNLSANVTSNLERITLSKSRDLMERSVHKLDSFDHESSPSAPPLHERTSSTSSSLTTDNNNDNDKYQTMGLDNKENRNDAEFSFTDSILDVLDQR